MQRREFLLSGSAAMLWSTSLFAQQRRDTVDVVVIGSGGAGLSAAITAADAGAKVLVLEKMPIIGGNTQLAAGGMNAAETKIQEAKGIKDDWRVMYEDTMKGGHDRNQPELVEIMTKGSAAAVGWLTDLGVKFSPSVHFSGGARIERSHEPDGGGAFGTYVTRILFDNVVKRQVEIRKNSKVVEILQRPDGAVRGVVVQDRRGQLYTVETRAIVVASGGYGSSPDKIAKLKPEYAQFTSTGQPGTTGDALEFAEKAGAEVFDLDQIQIHPTQAVGAKTLISESLRGGGAILVNRDGKRFTNELGTRDATSAKVLQQNGQMAFIVFDENLKQRRKMIEGYFHLGLVKEGDTLESLAKAAGMDAANFVRTAETYNSYQAAKSDPEFKRADLPLPLARPKFYAIAVKPGIHFTMGGIRINGRTQVMSRQKQPIPGLFAAGEVTGGVHGGNRIGGTSMTALFTFGPIAGREAAAYVKG
jgi:fumarate reductase flavoprotein subunit